MLVSFAVPAPLLALLPGVPLSSATAALGAASGPATSTALTQYIPDAIKPGATAIVQTVGAFAMTPQGAAVITFGSSAVLFRCGRVLPPW